MKNILVVVAHLDDETFGMHGTIQKLKKDNNITIYVMCKGRDNKNSDQRLKAIFKIYKDINVIVDSYYDLTLDRESQNIISDKIRNVIIENDIDVVYTNANDLHFEHCIINRCTKVASRDIVKELYEIYIPGSSNITQFNSKVIENINITNKIDACKKYSTEISNNLINKIEISSKFIGLSFNYDNAELFKLIYKKE